MEGSERGQFDLTFGRCIWSDMPTASFLLPAGVMKGSFKAPMIKLRVIRSLSILLGKKIVGVEENERGQIDLTIGRCI